MQSESSLFPVQIALEVQAEYGPSDFLYKEKTHTLNLQKWNLSLVQSELHVLYNVVALMKGKLYGPRNALAYAFNISSHHIWRTSNCFISPKDIFLGTNLPLPRFKGDAPHRYTSMEPKNPEVGITFASPLNWGSGKFEPWNALFGEIKQFDVHQIWWLRPIFRHITVLLHILMEASAIRITNRFLTPESSKVTNSILRVDRDILHGMCPWKVACLTQLGYRNLTKCRLLCSLFPPQPFFGVNNLYTFYTIRTFPPLLLFLRWTPWIILWVFILSHRLNPLNLRGPQPHESQMCWMLAYPQHAVAASTGIYITGHSSDV